MRVSEVSKEDGLACAHLLNALKLARFSNLSSEDMESLLSAKRWAHALAMQMASVLKEVPTAPKVNTPVKASDAPQGGFKIKAMGPIGGASAVKKKKK